MITAKNFIVSNEVKQGFLLTNSTDELKDIIKSHIEFAKLHVEACKKEILEKIEMDVEYDTDRIAYPILEEESILNAYPLENIK